MIIERAPQCDKITCEAFGPRRQPVPASGAGHALVDLAGVAKFRNHAEIAAKCFNHVVYDDDASITFLPAEPGTSKVVCASK